MLQSIFRTIPKEIAVQHIYKKFKVPQYIPKWALDSPRLFRDSDQFNPCMNVTRDSDQFNPCMNVTIISNDFIIVEDQMQAFEDIDIGKYESPHLTCFRGIFGKMTLLLQNYDKYASPEELALGKRILEGTYYPKNTLLEYKLHDISRELDYHNSKSIRENSYNFDDTPVKIHFSPLDICHL